MYCTLLAKVNGWASRKLQSKKLSLRGRRQVRQHFSLTQLSTSAANDDMSESAVLATYDSNSWQSNKMNYSLCQGNDWNQRQTLRAKCIKYATEWKLSHHFCYNSRFTRQNGLASSPQFSSSTSSGKEPMEISDTGLL